VDKYYNVVKFSAAIACISYTLIRIETLSFFTRYHQLLVIGSALYVLLLLVLHATFSTQHVWIIAAIFSVAMNFTYIIEAKSIGKHYAVELCVSAFLILLSIFGVILHPLFVIIAILGHGVWDLLKHAGAGIPFLRWYTLGCVVVDMFYGITLLIFFLQTL
jgi:hypothetical protein